MAKLLPTALLGFLVALFVDKLVTAQGFRQDISIAPKKIMDMVEQKRERVELSRIKV